MMRPWRRAVCAFSLFWAAGAGPSWAGVVLVSNDGSRTYISDGRIKEVGEEPQTFIFDTGKEEILLLDREKQVFARGTVDQFCEAGARMVKSAMEGLSPEEKAIMEQLMGGKKEVDSPPDVSIAPAGSGGKIAGLETEKYIVNSNGQKYEELWITGDRTIMGEFKNLRKLAGMSARMGQCMGESIGLGEQALPETSPEYQALFQKGYPLKSVSFETGAPQEEMAIVSVEKKSLPDSEFQPPGDYREVTFEEVLESGAEN